MHQLTGYHRPTSLNETLDLLDGTRIVLGGGTTIRHDGGGAATEVVDLQRLGLDEISFDDERIDVGAMVTLHSLVDNERAPDLIRHAARGELPSTLRTLATVGGTVVGGGSESVLLAALLVHDSVVRFADDRDIALDAVLGQGVGPTDLILGVEFADGGRTAIAATGRTPADTPIVAAVGRLADDGLRIALTGVASTPVLVDPEDLGRIQPPGDFRGTPSYRKHLAEVLVGRVVEELV